MDPRDALPHAPRPVDGDVMQCQRGKVFGRCDKMTVDSRKYCQLGSTDNGLVLSPTNRLPACIVPHENIKPVDHYRKSRRCR